MLLWYREAVEELIFAKNAVQNAWSLGRGMEHAFCQQIKRATLMGSFISTESIKFERLGEQEIGWIVIYLLFNC